MRGTRSIGSSAGSAAAATRRNRAPVSLPARASATFVAGSAANTAVPAGSVAPVGAGERGHRELRGAARRRAAALSVRTAVGESISST